MDDPFFCACFCLSLKHSIPFCTMVDLQLSFYRPLCYKSRVHCPLLHDLRTKSAIPTGVHSYFVVSSFKCEGNNGCHDLIPNPCMLCSCKRLLVVLLGAHHSGQTRSTTSWSVQDSLCYALCTWSWRRTAVTLSVQTAKLVNRYKSATSYPLSDHGILDSQINITMLEY